MIIGGLLHAVELVVVHLGKIIVAFLHHHMARRAGATAAAGVFQMEADVHRDIEQRFRLPIPFIRQLALFELECLTRWKERNSRHYKQLYVWPIGNRPLGSKAARPPQYALLSDPCYFPRTSIP